jgi:DNA-binding transcriptional regulator YhcF (GntR family)
MFDLLSFYGRVTFMRTNILKPTPMQAARKAAWPVCAVNQVYPKASALYFALCRMAPVGKHIFVTSRAELAEKTGVTLNPKTVSRILKILVKAKWIKKRRKRLVISKPGEEPKRYISYIRIKFLIANRLPEGWREGTTRASQAKLLREKVYQSTAFGAIPKKAWRTSFKKGVKNLTYWLMKAGFEIPIFQTSGADMALAWPNTRPDFRLRLRHMDGHAHLAVDKQTPKSDWEVIYFIQSIHGLKLKGETFGLALLKILDGTEPVDKDVYPFTSEATRLTMQKAASLTLPAQPAAPKPAAVLVVETPAF